MQIHGAWFSTGYGFTGIVWLPDLVAISGFRFTLGPPVLGMLFGQSHEPLVEFQNAHEMFPLLSGCCQAATTPTLDPHSHAADGRFPAGPL